MARPSFTRAWAASRHIYDPSNPGGRVASVVGGFVAKNINNPNESQRWNNTCAVRISYILNQTGVAIPTINGQTVSGEDKAQYFFRVRDLIVFLRSRWGAPETIQHPPSGGGALAGRKGLILFTVSGWGDAQGHATLYDGNSCYDSCYFNEPGVGYRTDNAHFWSLS